MILKRFFVLCVLAVGLSACGVLAPPPEETTLQDRLAVFPTEDLDFVAPVKIRWNAHQVPFIQAEDDLDGAYALGLVHAHLRLAQMEILKRIAQGRLSEMAGPFTVDIDAGLRALGYGRVAQEALASMPVESRDWLDRYVAGVNRYKAHAQTVGLPHEYTVLGLENEPWTAADTITVGRLTGTDVNWLVLFGLLPYADDPNFETILRAVIDAGQGTPPSATVALADLEGTAKRNPIMEQVAALTVPLARSGSNSLAIAPHRSASGAAMIANDPHLGFLIPNAWVIAGLKTPSYHVGGMMVPGIPVFGFGRTPDLAWGGTNLRSLNSDLIDVSSLPEEAFDEETHEIGVRFWFDETVRNRVTQYGPVVSDVGAIPDYRGTPFALRWIGHTPSDEITALLGAMKARTVQEFRTAVEEFAIPAQNFLVADTQGQIAHVIATHIPERSSGDLYAPVVTTPEQADMIWANVLKASTLPSTINPVEGYLASSNNRPFENGPMLGRFFSPNERVRRLNSLAQNGDSVTLEDLANWQRDVLSPLSLEVRDAILARFDQSPDLSPEHPALEVLASWDGRFEVDSQGALVFHAFVTGFSETAYGINQESDEQTLLSSAASRYARAFMLNDLPIMSEETWRAAAENGLSQTDTFIESDAVWGDLHRMYVRHILGNAPIIGGAYDYDNIPIAGSRETVFKTSHDYTLEEHRSTFGAQSRHLSDLGDLDENYFVLFGGQDGWLNSSTQLDQVPMWQNGSYIQVPLSDAAVKEQFDRVLILGPSR